MSCGTQSGKPPSSVSQNGTTMQEPVVFFVIGLFFAAPSGRSEAHPRSIAPLQNHGKMQWVAHTLKSNRFFCTVTACYLEFGCGCWR
jgi:hypothetical protein